MADLRDSETRDDDSHARRNAEQLAMADGEGAEDLPAIHVGDHATDREDDEDGATLLVVGTPSKTADECTAGPKTVAEWNPDYPADDAVIKVVYPQRTDIDVRTLKRYSFPRSRLALEAPVHDRDEEDDDTEWVEDDNGNRVPKRSEPADFGGGESSGVQDL